MTEKIHMLIIIILVPGIINKIAYYFLKLMPKFIVYNFLGKEKEL